MGKFSEYASAGTLQELLLCACYIVELAWAVTSVLHIS